MNATESLTLKIKSDYLSHSRFREGDKLPTFKKLAQMYNISEPTIGKAVDYLSRQGYLAKRRGSGVYISKMFDNETDYSSVSRPVIGCIVQNMNLTIGKCDL